MLLPQSSQLKGNKLFSKFIEGGPESTLRSGSLNPRLCVVSVTSVAQLVIFRQIKPPGYIKLKVAGLTSILLCTSPSVFVFESLLSKRTPLLSNVSNVQRKNTIPD